MPLLQSVGMEERRQMLCRVKGFWPVQQVAAPECEATGAHLLILRVSETSEMEIDLVKVPLFGEENLEIAIFKTVV